MNYGYYGQGRAKNLESATGLWVVMILEVRKGTYSWSRVCPLQLGRFDWNKINSRVRCLLRKTASLFLRDYLFLYLLLLNGSDRDSLFVLPTNAMRL